VDRLVSLLLGQSGQRLPQELKGDGRVLTTTEADYPGPAVPRVDLDNLSVNVFNRALAEDTLARSDAEAAVLWGRCWSLGSALFRHGNQGVVFASDPLIYDEREQL